MAKFTFTCDTFGNFTFAASTFAGEGGGVPSPSVTLQDIFCHRFTEQSDFEQFVSDFNAAIADPTTFSAADQAYLDLYDDGTIGYDDRDAWLHYLLTTNGFTDERLSFANPTPTTIAESDPLGLRLGRTNIIIIDINNTNAVEITSATNDCTLNGVPDGSVWEVDGVTYRRNLWKNFRAMNEGPASGVGITFASVRRFPTDGSEVTVYIRGGQYTETSEVTFTKNDNASTSNTKIIVRGYPGEVPKASFRNSQTGARFRLDPGIAITRKVILEAIEQIGYVDTAGTKIFCPHLMWIKGRVELGGVGSDTADGSVIRKCIMRDHRSISPAHADAASLPNLVDSQYSNRSYFGDTTKTSGYAYGLTVSSQNILIEQNYFRSVVDEWPYEQSPPSDFAGDFISCLGTYGGNITICRNVFDGQAYHAQVGGGGISGGPVIIEYNDIRNPAHTCASVGSSNSIVRYNRIHDFNTSDPYEAHGLQLTPPTATNVTGVQIYGNVIWSDTIFGPTFGMTLATTNNATLGELDGFEIHDNIFYGVGILIGYQTLDHATANRNKNHNIHDNVFDGLPAYNRGVNAYDAPILLNMFQPHLNSFYGCQLDNNLVLRHDGDTTLMINIISPGPSIDEYDLAGLNTFPNCSGNYSADPMFLDPDNGNFTFTSAASPVYDQFTGSEVPLVDFTDADLLEGVCDHFSVCCEISTRPQYTCVISVRSCE